MSQTIFLAVKWDGPDTIHDSEQGVSPPPSTVLSRGALWAASEHRPETWGGGCGHYAVWEALGQDCFCGPAHPAKPVLMLLWGLLGTQVQPPPEHTALSIVNASEQHHGFKGWSPHSMAFSIDGDGLGDGQSRTAPSCPTGSQAGLAVTS